MAGLLKAVICVLNSKYIHSSLAPWYFVAAAEKYCKCDVDVKVVEGTINDPPEVAVRRIIELRPQLVGFSCYIWNITKTRELIKLVKEGLPDAIIVLGGPEVSYNAGDVLREEPLADYIISGEGELPFARLLDSIACGVPVRDTPGLCYRDGENIVTGEPYTTTDVPPNPYIEGYFANLDGRMAYLETSRGCPYRCAFCLSGRQEGVRFFPMERAEEDIIKLANSGAKTVKFVDRTFNADKKRAAELFRFLIENYEKRIPHGARFHFEIAGDLLDEETFRILSKAPPSLIQFEIGLQSFNGETLAAIDRKTDTEKLRANIARLVDMGNIHIHIDLIAGLPYEDMESFERSFNIAFGLRPHMLQLGFLKLLHGAPMREEPGRFPCDFGSEPPYEVRSTLWLGTGEISDLRAAEDALERLYNSGRFRRTLRYVMERTKMSPFRLFMDFGRVAADKDIFGISLDDYTAIVYSYFRKLSGVDPAVLRDVMVCDRLATNASGRLPPVLAVRDDAVEKAARKAGIESALRAKDGTRRGFAYLYTENCLVVADYSDRDPVTREYRSVFYHVDQ